MRGTVVEEERRRLAEARLDTWLWFEIREKRKNLPLESFDYENLREYLTEFEYEPRINKLINITSKRHLLPIDQLKWIANDERQINWLLSYATKTLGVDLSPLPTRLSGRELLLAKIDFYNIDLDEKSSIIDKMRSDWNEYLKSDIIFKWFKDKEEAVRCAFAWEWLIKNKPRETYGQQAINNHNELLRFYDWIEVNEAQKKLDVASIKKKWSQQKYREGMKGKSQYNFMLSDQVIADLDKMAGRYEATRPQIIEALIEMEAAQGNYLPKKIKKTSLY
ncbi:hypothetical protein GTP91_14830 [Rugamonas sp. FT82W]|uniref:Uncharacterized protein n=1 Tax=Duganella vulcania TaxID=2692166 RepID=A0A845G4Q0_9BURK|nr:hypothetical protein [Duganella vulcania]MYM88442.1 hypothetical protein [Duganella vulcania]